jgi:8-oxo-dGTP diphosphatase
MRHFTLGFIFNQNFSEVLLMHKNRPDWQAGKINGVGGEIKPKEKSIDCIVREVKEEAGVKTQKKDWAYFGKLRADSCRVDLYALRYMGSASGFCTTTDEKVEWFKVNHLPDNVIDHLNWMILLALEKLKNSDFKGCVVKYAQKVKDE